MKILAIDFGLKHFGIAISEGFLAEPFKELIVKNKEKTLKQLKEICQQNKIEKVVIGMPEGKLTPIIKKWANTLRAKINLPIVFQDETLTSKEAKRKMVEAGKPLKKRRKSEHLIAACLILQSYLDENT